MRRLARTTLLIGAIVCAPRHALAQLGEIHLGVVGSYGTATSFGPGAGVIAGVAAGRLVYIGMRWVQYTGTSPALMNGDTTAHFSMRSQSFAFDAGVLIPVAAVEIVPGLSMGSTRFAQRASQRDAAVSAWTHDGEFTIAPGIAVHVRVSHLLLIPEVQYVIAGDPQRLPNMSHRGLLSSMRLVYTREVRPIRH